jgi:hypothetical protein
MLEYAYYEQISALFHTKTILLYIYIKIMRRKRIENDGLYMLFYNSKYESTFHVCLSVMTTTCICACIYAGEQGQSKNKKEYLVHY